MKDLIIIFWAICGYASRTIGASRQGKWLKRGRLGIMERIPTIGCSEKDIWIQGRLNTTICPWILFYLYFDFILTLYGLEQNWNNCKIKADLRIVKVVIFFYNLFNYKSKNWGVLENSLKRVRAFRFGCWREGKSGVPGEKPLGAKERTNNKLNSHMAWTSGFEHEPHWWEARALTTAPPLLPQYTLDLKRHILAA